MAVKSLGRPADISTMTDVPAAREFLRACQNPDGGWGYFAGKQSWLEPTAYAALALMRDGRPDDSGRRAWTLVRSWQNADGGWRPNASVRDSTWTTALAVTLGDTMGDAGPVDRGVQWLLAAAGAESSTFSRALRLFGIGGWEREVKHKGWPWRPGTSAWVEPTAHALVALRRVEAKRPAARLRARIETGERMLLAARSSDGGWNYGSPRALGVDLPSYPETTALALLGLQRGAPPDAFDKAHAYAGSPDSSALARAWLEVALRIGGREPAGPHSERMHARDVMLAAIQCLAEREGNWTLLGAGARA